MIYPENMRIAVELPEDVAMLPNPARAALEALAIAGYKTEALAHFQAARLLGLSRFEFDDFLISREIYDHAYSIEDLLHDLSDLDSLRARGLLPNL